MPQQKHLSEEQLTKLEIDISIDPSKLDEEWLAQSGTHRFICDALLTAENELAREKARLDISIRKNPAEYKNVPMDANGKIKLTESVILSVLTLKASYQEALAYHSRLKALAKASDHKKQALENLTALYRSEYFAGPSVPRTLRPGKRFNPHDDIAADQTAGLNERMQQKKEPRQRRDQNR